MHAFYHLIGNKMCFDKVIVLSFWPHATNMLVSLWPSVLHHSATWYSLFQGRFSSALPPGSLPAFEIASKTFCLGLCQDASLSLTAITSQLQPAQTPLNEASSLRCIHIFFFLFIDKPPSLCSKSFLCLTWRPGQVSEEQRGQKQSGRAASSVSSGPHCPAMVTSVASFQILRTFPPLKDSCYMRVRLYSYLLYKWMYNMVKTSPILTGGYSTVSHREKKKSFLQLHCENWWTLISAR